MILGEKVGAKEGIMHNRNIIQRIFAALLCVLLMVTMLDVSTWAEKNTDIEALAGSSMKITVAPTPKPTAIPISIMENLADVDGIEEISLTTNAFDSRIQKLRYGYSEKGRELICWSLSPETFDKTILLNFEIHGWEDEYAADGQVLVDFANNLVQYFSGARDLHRTRLLLIPSCNPDGLLEGTTNNGFGRCNSMGVDLNRDFDASHQVYTSARNYTEYPFSAKESRALRDLTLAARPDIAIDFHGWENCVIGNKDLAEVFSTNLGLTHRKELTETAHGYFSYWAQLQGADAMLVEFKDSNSVPVSSVASAIEQLMTGDYGLHSTKYVLDPEYSPYPDLKTYAITNGRVYTQANVGDSGTSFGYIDGATDECTIRQIYINGWCKLWYPVGSNTKTAYAQTSAFISEEDKVTPYQIGLSSTATVYTKPDGSTKYGSVWASDPVTVVAERGKWLQVIYPLDAGGYKMGWIARPDNILPTSTPTPTNTPMPTNTPAPTNTPMPTNTPTPTIIPEHPLTPIPNPNIMAVFKVGSVTAIKGDDVTVSVSLTKNPGIAGFALDVQYDTNVLTLKNGRSTDILGGSFSINENTISWYNSENIFVTGDIFELTFAMAEGTNMDSAIVNLAMHNGRSNVVNEEGDNIDTDFQGGTVNIRRWVPGDVTGDDDVTIADVVKINRYVLGKIQLTPIELFAADVTGDDDVTIADVVKVNRYVLGKVKSFE